MATASECYRRHSVWETSALKREALAAARFSNKQAEQQRIDVVEWLLESEKAKVDRQPALYLGVLDDLGNALSALVVTENEFARFVSSGHQQQLFGALRESTDSAMDEEKEPGLEVGGRR